MSPNSREKVDALQHKSDNVHDDDLKAWCLPLTKMTLITQKLPPFHHNVESLCFTICHWRKSYEMVSTCQHL